MLSLWTIPNPFLSSCYLSFPRTFYPIISPPFSLISFISKISIYFYIFDFRSLSSICYLLSTESSPIFRHPHVSPSRITSFEVLFQKTHPCYFHSHFPIFCPNKVILLQHYFSPLIFFTSFPSTTPKQLRVSVPSTSQLLLASLSFTVNTSTGVGEFPRGYFLETIGFPSVFECLL